MRRAEWTILVVLLALALLLRLRDPLSSPIIGAEDPYLHMARTWNLLQGEGVKDYPAGFMALLAPFALAGAQAFYWVVRLLPALLGALAVGGTWLLARRHVGPVAAIGSALLLACMPEHVFRTNLMVPTAFVLALLPFLLGWCLQAAKGNVGALAAACGSLVALLVVHPWSAALMLVPLAIWGSVTAARRMRVGATTRARWAAGGILAGLAALIGLLRFTRIGDPLPFVTREAMPRLAAFLRGEPPGAPLYVDLDWMLTLPALVLAAAGTILVFIRRQPLGILALVWSATLLPLTLADWFGLWFVPHRVVGYLAIGIALLSGIALHDLVRSAWRWGAKGVLRVAGTACALLALLAVPAGWETQDWYRLFDEDDYDAWREVAAGDPSLVIVGSWQAEAGYRALTGRPVQHNVAFFYDTNVRQGFLAEHPDLVVLVEPHLVQNGHPTGFTQDWAALGAWGDVAAFQAPAGGTREP